MKALFVLSCLLITASAAPRTVLLIAGPKSHGPVEHEHPAAVQLMADHLNSSGADITAEVSMGWPADPQKLNADSIVIYGDGLKVHPANGQAGALLKRHQAGKGLAVLHFALEANEPDLIRALDQTIGGHFDPAWSVNPIWKMTSPILAPHPITHGVKPFEIEDEFYYHIRLQPDVTHILKALPPVSSLGADGPRSGNPEIRQKLANNEPQTLAWSKEDPTTGARGFGFTGGHYLQHFHHPDFRTLLLNAIAWTAKADIPPDGLKGKTTEQPIFETIDLAIAKGDLDDVKRHIAADPARAKQGGKPTSRPPLEQAILRNKTEIAEYLLTAGADPNTTNASQRTPLHLAVDRNNPAVSTALLKAGANPDLLDQEGWTPLHHAAAKNQFENAKAILAGGAKPTTLSARGGTPLHEAAASGGEEIIRLFLQHGLDPNQKSKEGVTPIDLAKQYKNEPALRALTEK
jgi:type 1 glutamine amidotransferase